MSKQSKRRVQRHPANGPVTPGTVPSFTPVPLRPRHDGWTPLRQVQLIRAMAELGCVAQAARTVGMSTTSAYQLYNHPHGASLRRAWDAALTQAMDRLADAMISRAIHGVAEPIFYKGEQVGERMRYNDGLGMWLLRLRAADRYGAWRDKLEVESRHPDGKSMVLLQSLRNLAEDARADAHGKPRPQRDPLPHERRADAAEQEGRRADEDYERTMREQVERDAWVARLDAIDRGEIVPKGCTPHPAPTSPTSAPPPSPGWPEDARNIDRGGPSVR